MVLALVACLLTPEALPAMPEAGIHGAQVVNGQWWVGGLRGLHRQTAKGWENVDERAVRQLAQHNGELWVLFGDGSVDKLVPARDRRFVDVLHGRAKRPWTSFIYASADGVILGGQGGFVDLRADAFKEHYTLKPSDIVTAIHPQGAALWIGTQQSGVYRMDAKKQQRFGFARGVSDPWITAIGTHQGEILLGTATHGLLAFREEKFSPVHAPSPRIRYLQGDWLGTMDGTFRRDADGWAKELGGEATFAASARTHRVLGTAQTVVLR